MEEEGPRILSRQPIMRRMVVAMIPCILASIYFFGWRSLIIVVVSCIVGFAAEYFFARRRKEPVTEAVFVSAIIYALIMPPTVPWHVLVFGMVFAIVFGKMVFGGFGFNIFNPAMVGRAFVYICFPIALTATWAPAAQGFWGALGTWSTALNPDVITTATPMALAKAGQAVPPLVHLMLGRLSGTMGVTSVIAILIGGGYVFISKTANRWIILTVISTYVILNGLLVILNVKVAPGILPALFGGGFLFGAFFMATDPVSAPKTHRARIVYSVIIAGSTVVIRNFSVFNGGFMFSLLIANMFAPIIDHAFKTRTTGKMPLEKDDPK
ncbi:MAG: RnfABCDGE type electron transport complex subunit D [candidate division WOR-3 bacterium]|nr:MAG: RnfABCDGE type electron transport complex subunit D [candidate division WOR-3 bacterium]